jgi:hypothetical protein
VVAFPGAVGAEQAQQLAELKAKIDSVENGATAVTRPQRASDQSHGDGS